MGKYMRKSKGTGGVALMEVSHSHTQPSLGVRTRARTLALERLQTSSSSSSSAAATAAAEGLEGEGEGGSGSYLQLRNRRLEKVSPIVLDGKRQKLSQLDTNLQQKSPSSGMKDTEENKEAPEPEEEEVKECLRHEKIEGAIKMKDKESRGSGGDLGVEETTSFGENVLEFGGRERSRSRSRRESTPCSLIRDADAIRTPGSSTRNIRVVTPRNRENLAAAAIIPAAAAEEMEAFFSRAEELQQRKFVDKYNFDPVSDRPLPGPYEWEKLNH